MNDKKEGEREVGTYENRLRDLIEKLDDDVKGKVIRVMYIYVSELLKD